jgi:hypothetical protein
MNHDTKDIKYMKSRIEHLEAFVKLKRAIIGHLEGIEYVSNIGMIFNAEREIEWLQIRLSEGL